MRRSERGFSLLEVLAAVSLLIVLFIPLVRSAIDGLRSEGESRRRMEASLLADNALADLEADLLIGIAPAIGEESWEVDEFRGTTRVTSFDLPVPDDADSAEEQRRLAGIDSLDGNLGIRQSIFPPPNSSQVSPLRKIEITVSWPGYGDPELGAEDVGERNRVVRTTFAFDLASVQQLLGPVDLEQQANALEALLPQ
jgi:type II secretory pathway pseudopilin PulG